MAEVNELSQRLSQTLNNLTEKKDILEQFAFQYEVLKTQLELLHSNPIDSSNISLQLNPVLRVPGKIIDPKKILASIGCEYFVEKEPLAAIKVVDNKLEYLVEAIGEFETKIKDAEKMMHEFNHLKDLGGNKHKGSKEEPGIEEGKEFPVMEIREELDEHGNVIQSSVEARDENSLKEIEDMGAKLGDDDGDELQAMLRDMGIISQSKKKLEEIDSDEESDLKITEQTIINKTKSVPNQYVKGSGTSNETKAEPHSEPRSDYPLSNADTTSDTTSRTQADNSSNALKYEALFKELGIVSVAQYQISSETTSSQKSEAVTLKSDLLQLQEIDQELAEMSDFNDDGDVGMEIEDYDFYENDWDEDDDSADWDEGQGRRVMPGLNHGDFLARLGKLRGEVKGMEDEQETGDSDDEILRKVNAATSKNLEETVVITPVLPVEPIEPTAKHNPKKKSVTFAKELEQVKEIENVSQELRKNQRVSKFKMNRSKLSVFTPSVDPVTQLKASGKVTDDIIDSEDLETIQSEDEDAVSAFIVEKTGTLPIIGNNSNKPLKLKEPLKPQQTSVNEIEPELQQQKKQSKFKASINDNAKFRNLNGPPPSISEKVEGFLTSQESKKQSRLKSSSSSVIELTPSSIEKDIVSFDGEPGKESYNNEGRSNVENVSSPMEDADLTSIRSYVTQEEEDFEDEELLNSITNEISVYRGSPQLELQEGDEDELENDYQNNYDIDEEDDYAYGSMVLDEIIENENVDDPDYFVNEQILQKEYHELRKKMIQKYGDRESNEQVKERILYNDDEGEELEPIDEHGNPIKVSRFRKSLDKR